MKRTIDGPDRVAGSPLHAALADARWIPIDVGALRLRPVTPLKRPSETSRGSLEPFQECDRSHLFQSE